MSRADRIARRRAVEAAREEREKAARARLADRVRGWVKEQLGQARAGLKRDA